MSNPARSEEEVTTILLGLIAWAGNATAASRYLKTEKGIGITPKTLYSWKTVYATRYDELREKYQSQLETNLANELRDVARLATETTRLAIERTRMRLEAGEEGDPARAAANMATVASKSTDKMNALLGRPQVITESRDATQILRSLIARHPALFQVVDEPKQIEQPTEAEAA